MMNRKLTIGISAVLAVLLMAWIVYIKRYSLNRSHLLLEFHEGMPPSQVESILNTRLKTLKHLGEDAQYFDPAINAEYGTLYGMEVTPEIKKRLAQRYSLIKMHSQPAGIEFKFFDNKLYGVVVYVVMKGANVDVFKNTCVDAETAYKKQFPTWERKDLNLLKGGYGLSTQTQTLHAYVRCDVQNQTVTWSVHATGSFSLE
jgi:hypothetical protein